MKHPVLSGLLRQWLGAGLAPGIHLVLLLAALPHPVTAQDANYWSIQYGPTGQLLGGVMIGGVRDLSATFYNPGGLALTDDPAFLISVDALQDERLKIKSRGFPAVSFTLQSSRVGTAPSMLAGIVPLSGEDSRVAWCYLPRQSSEFLVNEHKILDDGTRRLAAEAVIDARTTDNWYGGTWARRTADGIGYGFSGYLAYHSHRYRGELNAQSDSAGSGATALVVDNVSYHHYRLLAKLGVAAEPGPFQVGLTLTTPGLGLFGEGDIGFTRSLTGVDVNGDQVPDELLVTAYQDKLDADYRSSWAVGIGGSWRRNNTRFHASTEWFSSVHGTALKGPPVSASPDLDDIVQEMDQALDSVFNVGVGVEHEFNPRTSIYGAFALDQSPLADETDPRYATSSWDLYHLTFGGQVRAFGNRITGGIAYAWGGDEQKNVLPPVVPDRPPLVDLGEIRFDYSRLTFMIGFELGTDGQSAPRDQE